MAAPVIALIRVSSGEYSEPEIGVNEGRLHELRRFLRRSDNLAEG